MLERVAIPSCYGEYYRCEYGMEFKLMEGLLVQIGGFRCNAECVKQSLNQTENSLCVLDVKPDTTAIK